LFFHSSFFIFFPIWYRALLLHFLRRGVRPPMWHFPPFQSSFFPPVRRLAVHSFTRRKITTPTLLTVSTLVARSVFYSPLFSLAIPSIFFGEVTFPFPYPSLLAAPHLPRARPGPVYLPTGQNSILFRNPLTLVHLRPFMALRGTVCSPACSHTFGA